MVVRESVPWVLALSRLTGSTKEPATGRGDAVLEYGAACAKGLWQEICRWTEQRPGRHGNENMEAAAGEWEGG